MSFLNKIFGVDDEENELPNMQWNHLEDINELDEIVKDSFRLPVVIFKHSTRCSISKMALKQFEHEFDLPHLLKPYLLDLLKFREISNEIAARFGVLHQSPQVILIKDGKAIFDASHEQINVHDLKELV